MQISMEELAGGVTKVTWDGRLDIAAAEAVDTNMKAIADSKKLVLIDMQKVSFLGSLGLRAIFSAARAIKSHGGKMVLFGPDELIEKVLKTGGVDAMVPIHNDFQSALTDLQ